MNVVVCSNFDCSFYHDGDCIAEKIFINVDGECESFKQKG